MAPKKPKGAGADRYSLDSVWEDYVKWNGGGVGDARDSVQRWGNVEEYLQDRHGLRTAPENGQDVQEYLDNYQSHPAALAAAKLHSLAQARPQVDSYEGTANYWLTDSDLAHGAALGLLKIRRDAKAKKLIPVDPEDGPQTGILKKAEIQKLLNEPVAKSRSPWSKSYANPRQQEKLRMASPDLAYRAAVEDINHRVIEYVRAAYKSHPDFMTKQGEVDRITALMAPMVAAGQMEVAQLTNAHLSNLFGLEHVPIPELSNLGRNGVDLKDELARPLWTAIKAARDGKPFDEALAAGEHRMERMLATDLQIAKVRQSREALKANGIETYQRVAGPKACWLCAIAATQTYYTEDLLPIHPGCGCDVAPLNGTQSDLDAKLDPKLTLSKDASQIRLMEPMVESDADAADYRKLIAVREHGETGPQLTWAHQKFTGPDDLPVPPSKEVLSQQVYDTVRKNGGITIDLAGHQPPDGYAYAPYKTTEFKVPESEFTPKHIDDYIEKHHKELSKPGNNLGMWTQDGNVFLDVSKVGPPTAATFAKAQAADQLAVFDLANFNEINLGTIDPITKEYTRLGTPTDLHSQYREQVRRADEASRAGSLAEVPGLDSGSPKRKRAKPLEWDGPPIAPPITPQWDGKKQTFGVELEFVSDMETRWRVKGFDLYKDAIRAGAREAQAFGSTPLTRKQMKSLLDRAPQIVHGRERGRRPISTNNPLLRAEGRDIAARAAASERTRWPFYRGMMVTDAQARKLLNADVISLPLSSFTGDETLAANFSDRGASGWLSKSVKKSARQGIYIKLQRGAKLAEISDVEQIGFGRFKVIESHQMSVKEWEDVGGGDWKMVEDKYGQRHLEPIGKRPIMLTIKQTSMIEADVADATPGTTTLKAKSQKPIPEITIVKKEPQFGTIDLKTGAINRSGDLITKVQPGPIPDYDNSYAVSKQLHARHPDLNVELGSMIDGKLARSTAQELDDLMTKYPDAQLRSAKSRSPYNFQHSTRYAQTDVYDRKVLSGTEIQFNDSFYMKKADLDRSYAKTTEIPEGKRYGYHPPLGEGNDAAKAIAAHEFGHTMDASGSYRAGGAVKDTLRREYLRLNPYTDEQKATDRVLVANAAKRGITIRQPIETRYEAWLHDSLSEYSFTQSGKLNPAEALAEAFGHGELDPKHITDAERALHKLAVDEHTKPYRRGMAKPGWEMATDAPKAVVDAKEAKRVAAQAKKDAAAAEKAAKAAEREAKHAAAQAKKAEADAIKAKKEEQGFGDVKKRIPHGTEIQPIRTARGTLDKKGTWDSVSDETLRENWKAALRDSDKFAWESGKVWYGDLNQLCANMSTTYGAAFRAKWGVDLTPDLVAGIMSSYSTNNGWAMNLVGVEQFLSGTAKLNKLFEPTAMHFQNKDWGVKPLLSYLRSGKGTVADYYAENLSAPKPYNFLKSIKGDKDAACVDRWVSRIMLHTNDYKFADEMWAAASKESGRYGFQRMRQAILDVANDPEFAGYDPFMLQAVPWVHVNGGDLAVANLDVGELFTAAKAEHSATEVTKLLTKESHRRGWS